LERVNVCEGEAEKAEKIRLGRMPHRYVPQNNKSINIILFLHDPVMRRASLLRFIGAFLALAFFFHDFAMSFCGPFVKLEAVEDGL
jgi:hypothetical protein